MEQEYVIDNIDSFNLKDIFECGQCFRWNNVSLEAEANKKLKKLMKHSNGVSGEAEISYTGVFGNNVINVTKIGKKIIFRGVCEGNIKEICNSYFDLNRDYKKIKEKLEKKDMYLKEAIQFGGGIRILNQDLWETTISFIISANNNIPRIKKIIENLSCNYGDKIRFEGKDFYTFPSPNQLSKASVEDLRAMGLGFRDIRVFQTTRQFLNGNFSFEMLQELHTDELHKKLCELPGVGPKVADCIELFSTLKRLEVFPVDVWVRKVMNELYIKKEDINRVSNVEIQILAKEMFGNIRGLAQQYLFYWKRES